MFVAGVRKVTGPFKFKIRFFQNLFYDEKDSSPGQRLGVKIPVFYSTGEIYDLVAAFFSLGALSRAYGIFGQITRKLS